MYPFKIPKLFNHKLTIPFQQYLQDWTSCGKSASDNKLDSQGSWVKHLYWQQDTWAAGKRFDLCIDHPQYTGNNITKLNIKIEQNKGYNKIRDTGQNIDKMDKTVRGNRGETYHSEGRLVKGRISYQTKLTTENGTTENGITARRGGGGLKYYLTSSARIWFQLHSPHRAKK